MREFHYVSCWSVICKYLLLHCLLAGYSWQQAKTTLVAGHAFAFSWRPMEEKNRTVISREEKQTQANHAVDGFEGFICDGES